MPKITPLTDSERDRQDAEIRRLLPIVRRYRGEDRGAAIRGLWDAAMDWKPSLGRLEPYAVQRARSSVLDERKWGRRGKTQFEPFDERTHCDRQRYRNSRHDVPCLVTRREVWKVVNTTLLTNPARLDRKSEAQLIMEMECRELVRMLFWDQMSSRDIALRWGVTQGRVAHIKKRAMSLILPAIRRLLRRKREANGV